MKWISVKDKPIPLAENILIVVKNKVFSVVLLAIGYVAIPTLKGKYEMELMSEDLISEIKYWMPRPRLP
jgi:hypothetical protein